MVATTGLVFAGLGHADGVADRRAHRDAGVDAAQRLERGQRVAADVAGHARAGSRAPPCRLEVCGQPAHSTGGRTSGSGAQPARCARGCEHAGLLETGAHQFRREFAQARERTPCPRPSMPSARQFASRSPARALRPRTPVRPMRRSARSSSSGSGQDAPSLSTLASGSDFAHVGVAGAGGDHAEASRRPFSQRLIGAVSRYSFRFASRSSTTAWRRARVRRDHHVLGRVLDEAARRRFGALAEAHRAAGVRQPRGACAR